MGDLKYIYQKELVKACFRHDMAYGDFKDLSRRTSTDKILRDKAFNIAKHPKYDGYQHELASMVYRFFDKKTLDGALKITPDKKLAKELRKLYIWGADLADMQLLSKFNKRIRFFIVCYCYF